MADNIELSPEEMAEMIEGGSPWVRDLAISVLGEVRKVAWWDMFGPLDDLVLGGALVAKAAALKPGEFVKCEQSEIPETVWTRHRKKYADPARHGLKLADAPAAAGVFRYPDGTLGMVIGYGQA